jgi:hypothetical protein
MAIQSDSDGAIATGDSGKIPQFNNHGTNSNCIATTACKGLGDIRHYVLVLDKKLGS